MVSRAVEIVEFELEKNVLAFFRAVCHTLKAFHCLKGSKRVFFFFFVMKNMIFKYFRPVLEFSRAQPCMNVMVFSPIFTSASIKKKKKIEQANQRKWLPN